MNSCEMRLKDCVLLSVRICNFVTSPSSIIVMKRIVVPSAKIILILSIVKKIVKSASTRTCVFVTFTPQGVQVKINASWFFVSVPLDIDTGGFMLRVSELEKLSKSEGDIVFSFGCDDAPPAP